MRFRYHVIAAALAAAVLASPVGANDEPQCKLVCPADCIEVHPDFQETPEQLMEKYTGLHG